MFAARLRWDVGPPGDRLTCCEARNLQRIGVVQPTRTAKAAERTADDKEWAALRRRPRRRGQNRAIVLVFDTQDAYRQGGPVWLGLVRSGQVWLGMVRSG